MPEPLDLDEARRALDAVPAPDLWYDAQRRAAAGEVVPLVVGAERRLHPGRWLAVAAACVVAVGTVAVFALNDGGQPVETGPLSTTPPTQAPTLYRSGGGCGFGVTGEPLVADEAAPPDDGLDPAGPWTVFRASLGSQVGTIAVPAHPVRDFVGERVEQIELRRGTADVWFATDFVEVRWFSDRDVVCESFSVTVTGGTEDGNRHAAVALAERILLPRELAGGAAPITDAVAGDWQLERSTVDGVPTDGNGLTFSFVDGQATWTDGCNHLSGTYQELGATTMRIGDVRSTGLPCPLNPTAEAVSAVMGAEQIDVTPGSGRDIVVLSTGTTVHTLVPVDPQTSTSSFVGVGQPIPESSVGAGSG